MIPVDDLTVMIAELLAAPARAPGGPEVREALRAAGVSEDAVAGRPRGGADHA